MKYRKAKKADLDQVVRVASTAFEDYLFLKVIKDLVRDPKQYPAFVEAMMRILVKVFLKHHSCLVAKGTDSFSGLSLKWGIRFAQVYFLEEYVVLL